MLHEVLRVAREAIVAFPNFGTWQHRARIMWYGRMPKGKALPFQWYDTPNIHLFTLHDFLALCKQDGIEVRETVCIPGGLVGRCLVGLGLRNLGAERVVVRIARG